MFPLLAGVVGFLLVPREVGVVLKWASPENGELPAPRREEPALSIPGIDAILAAEGREKLLLLAKAIPTMDGADLALLLQKLIDQEDDSDIAFAAAVRTVLHHWLEFDPEAVVDFVKKKSGPRVPSLPDLLRQWQAIDSSAALAWAEANGLTHYVSAASLCRDHFRELVARDRPAALREASRLTEHQEVAYVAIVETWATEEPEAAIRWATALTDPVVRERVLPVLLDTLAEAGHPERAIALAHELDDPSLVDSGYYSTFLPKWIESDEAGIGSWYGASVKDAESAKALLKNRWIKFFCYGTSSHPNHKYPLFALSALTAASPWISTLGNSVYDNQLGPALARTFQIVAREDLGAASACLTRLAPEVLSASLISSYVEGWATTEPEKALAFAEHLPVEYQTEGRSSRNLRSSSIHKVFQEWSKREPSAAAQHVDANVELQPYGRTVVEIWSEQDPQAALDWIGEKPQEEQVPLLTASLGQIIQHDLEAGLELIEKLPSEDQQRHRRTAMQEWMKQSAEEASAYMRDFELDEYYQDTFAALGRAWNEEDLAALGDYLTSLEPGTNRDAAVAALSLRLIDRVEPDFPLALEWIESINDAEFRGEQRKWAQGLWWVKAPTARKEHP